MKSVQNIVVWMNVGLLLSSINAVESKIYCSEKRENALYAVTVLNLK